MPVILRHKGFKFYFFSNEMDEPIHIHINKAEKNCKIWLVPKIELEYSYGFTSKEISEIFEIVIKNQKTLKNKWDEYFSQA